MSEHDLIQRMADTLYSETGVVAKIGNIEGGVRVLVWLVTTMLVVGGLFISYVTYEHSVSPNHSMVFANKPVKTASFDYSDADTQ